MNNIKSFDFVDCLVIDFSVDKTISSLNVIVEAYYPLRVNNTREKGLLKITCNQILMLNLKKNEEFDSDILQPYAKDGNDVKANEIYSIEYKYNENGVIEIYFKSDFLYFELMCNSIEFFEIDKL